MQILTDTTVEGGVSIRLTPGQVVKFVEKDGIEELHIGYGKEALNRRKLIIFSVSYTHLTLPTNREV